MAVVSVVQSFPNEQYTENEKEAQLVLTYYVEVDDQTNNAQFARNAVGYSVGGVLGGTSPPLYVKNVQARRQESTPLIFIVEVTFSTKDDKPDNTKPWDVTVTIDGVEYTETVWEDRNKKKILNSAGQVFDPTVEKTYNDQEITVSFKTRTLNEAALDAARGKLNSDAVSMNITCGLNNPITYSRNFPVESLKMTKGSARIVIGDIDPYWDINLTMVYREPVTDENGNQISGWTKRIVDRGYYELGDGAGGGGSSEGGGGGGDCSGLVAIKDCHHEPVTAPVLLNGHGHQLKPDAQGNLKAVLLNFPVDDMAAFMPVLSTVNGGEHD